MRSNVIANLIKEEWYGYRRMLFWYFSISVMLLIAMIICSRNDWVMNQVNQFGISFGQFSMIVLILLFMAYAIFWIIIMNKMEQEQKSGHYTLLHILPVTIKEIVTSKYIFKFLMMGLLFGWLCGLWLLYEISFPYADSSRAWAALCTFGFFYAFSVLAVQTAFLFRWGMSYSYALLLILLMALTQFEFAGQIADQTIKWIEQAPLLLWGIAAVLTFSIWLICWRWSVKAYRKY